LAWVVERGVDVLGAGRVHDDLWVAGQLEQGAEAARVRRRLSALWGAMEDRNRSER
jgi:hypothetical protein